MEFPAYLEKHGVTFEVANPGDYNRLKALFYEEVSNPNAAKEATPAEENAKAVETVNKPKAKRGK